VINVVFEQEFVLLVLLVLLDLLVLLVLLLLLVLLILHTILFYIKGHLGLGAISVEMEFLVSEEEHILVVLVVLLVLLVLLV
jgi:hypothetical protein